MASAYSQITEQNKPKTNARTPFDVAYEKSDGTEYKGVRRWEVQHPKHKKSLRVAAPDENSAIVAAAKRWGETWTSLDFYPMCTVIKKV